MNRDEYARITNILGVFQSFGHIDPYVLKKKQNLGTEVHEAVAAYMQNRFFPTSEKAQGYLESFIKWYDMHPGILVESEKRLYDDQLCVTGQIDALVRFDGQEFLLDFKTSAMANPKIWNLQAAFYQHLLSVNNFLTDGTSIFLQLLPNGDCALEHLFNFRSETWAICMHAWSMYWYFHPRYEKVVEQNPLVI